MTSNTTRPARALVLGVTSFKPQHMQLCATTWKDAIMLVLNSFNGCIPSTSSIITTAYTDTGIFCPATMSVKIPTPLNPTTAPVLTPLCARATCLSSSLKTANKDEKNGAPKVQLPGSLADKLNPHTFLVSTPSIPSHSPLA